MIQVLLALLIAGGSIGGRFAPRSLSVVTIDDEVIVSNSLPLFGTLCEDAPVTGNPHEWAQVLYTLPKGETVRLREQSHGEDRSWVMIKPAEWIPLRAVCNDTGD